MSQRIQMIETLLYIGLSFILAAVVYSIINQIKYNRFVKELMRKEKRCYGIYFAFVKDQLQTSKYKILNEQTKPKRKN
jgi:hypothetical protein